MGDNFPERQFVGGQFSGAQFSAGYFSGGIFPRTVIFTCRFRCRCQCRYAHTEISKGHFPGFCQFHMEKKELALKMKNLYDFPYSLMHTL